MYRYANKTSAYIKRFQIKYRKKFKNKKINLALKSILYCLLFCIIKLKWYPINTIYYDVDTNYLHWSSQLPAISVCQSFPFSNKPGEYEQNFVKNLLKPTDHYCYNCTSNNNTKNIPKKGYSQIVAKKLLPCNRLFLKCWWNEEMFDCCNSFKYLQTKYGICFSANSEMTEPTNKFEVSYFSKEANIEIEITKPVQIYLHEIRDISFIKLQRGIKMRNGMHLKVLFSSIETKSSSSAKWISLDQRNCFIQNEKILTGYRSYSQSACLEQIVAKKQTSICGCAHHLLATRGIFKECDIDGLLCLDKNNESLNINDHNSCLSACDTIEPNIVWHQIVKKFNNSNKVSFRLTAPPTERFILKSKIDLIGSIAALACLSRLFTNESIFSLFKTYYSRKRQRHAMIKSFYCRNYSCILY